MKFVKATEINKRIEKSADKQEQPNDFLNEVLSACKEQGVKDCLLVNQVQPSLSALSMHRLIYEFAQTGKDSANDFLEFASQKLKVENLEQIAKDTIDQFLNALWCEIHYGRITASKLYEAAQCNTAYGSLVKIILGARKVPDTKYMKRGRVLEPRVVKVVEKKIGDGIVKKSGIVLNQEFPIFGASADGVNKNYVLEVKCPSSEEARSRYLDGKNQPQIKFKLQILLQIMLYNKDYGYFCVAHHNFESNSQVEIVKVVRNDWLCLSYMKKARKFWCENIFPLLLKSVSGES